MEPDQGQRPADREACLREWEQPGEPYREMYLHLFRAVTRAIEALRDGRSWDAEHRLIQAQQETEALYIDAGDPADET